MLTSPRPIEPVKNKSFSRPRRVAMKESLRRHSAAFTSSPYLPKAAAPKRRCPSRRFPILRLTLMNTASSNPTSRCSAASPRRPAVKCLIRRNLPTVSNVSTLLRPVKAGKAGKPGGHWRARDFFCFLQIWFLEVGQRAGLLFDPPVACLSLHQVNSVKFFSELSNSVGDCIRETVHPDFVVVSIVVDSVWSLPCVCAKTSADARGAFYADAAHGAALRRQG